MFNFNWNLFNPKMGLIFTVGCIVVFSLPAQDSFSALAGGVSALMAWLTIIIAPKVPRREHLTGIVVYTLVGCVLTVLAASFAPHSVALVTSMGVVTFLGYMCLLRGVHAFLVGWCLVYWYLLVPLFLGEGSLWPVLVGHLMGSGLVLLLNSVKPIWAIAMNREYSSPETAGKDETGSATTEETATVRFTASFALVVSLSIVTGLGLGVRFLATDPTLIANATLNMISPSLQQTWHSAVERLVLGTAGLLGGFYLGWFFPEPWVGMMVMIVCSFLTLALVYVNFGLLVCAMFFLIAYQWGTMQSNAAHLIGNEKLLGEFLGVTMAVIAIAALNSLRRRFSSA